MNEQELWTHKLWAEYMSAYQVLVEKRLSMHPHEEALLPEIRKSLLGGGGQCAAALAYIPFLSTEHALSLSPAILEVSLSVSGQTQTARTQLNSLPKTAVLTMVQNALGEVIKRGDYEEYACLMALWQELGEIESATNFARRAAQDSNEDLRDVANAFLEKTEPKP